MRRPVAVAILTTVCGAAAAAQIGIVEPNPVPAAHSHPASPPPKAGDQPAGTKQTPAREKPPTPRADNPEKGRVPIVVNATLDRTAVWIGDPVTYTIEITCPPGTDILAADISRDRLKLAGLDVTGAVQQREVNADGTIVYRAQFRLVSYATDGSRVGIEPQPVRYYVHTAGHPPETLVPADEVQLPGRTIAVRSTLPDGDVEWIRDTRTIALLPAAVNYLTPFGLVAVALTLVPVVLGSARLLKHRKPRRTSRSARQTMQHYRQLLDEIRALDVSADASVRRDVFDKLNELVRDRLTDLDIPARNLTADEIEQSIIDRAGRLPAGTIAGMLRTCERAVYGRSEELPGPESVAAALDEAERLLAARPR
jgi:hypothetical protein